MKTKILKGKLARTQVNLIILLASYIIPFSAFRSYVSYDHKDRENLKRIRIPTQVKLGVRGSVE